MSSSIHLMYWTLLCISYYTTHNTLFMYVSKYIGPFVHLLQFRYSGESGAHRHNPIYIYIHIICISVSLTLLAAACLTHSPFGSLPLPCSMPQTIYFSFSQYFSISHHFPFILVRANVVLTHSLEFPLRAHRVSLSCIIFFFFFSHQFFPFLLHRIKHILYLLS